MNFFSPRSCLTTAALVMCALPATADTTRVKSGPSAMHSSLTDLALTLQERPNARQLTPAQRSLLNAITIHYDRQNPKVIYYSMPMSIPDAEISRGNAFTESPNPIALDSMQRIDAFLRARANELAGLTPQSASPYREILFQANPGESPAAENTPDTVKELTEASEKQFAGLSQGQKQRFVDLFRLESARLGILSLPPNLDFEEALKQWSTVLKTMAVVNISVPVGFQLDTATFEAFGILRQGLPDYEFIQLGAAPAWELLNDVVLSDRDTKDAVGNNVFLPTLKTDAGLTLGLGDGSRRTVASSGGVLTYSLTYAGALRYGYGTLDNADPLVSAARLDMRENLPGYLQQKRKTNVNFQGKAVCRFKAEVVYDAVFALEKRGGVAVPLSWHGERKNSLDQGPDLNECQIFDAAGNPSNMDDPEIAKIATAARNMHVNRNLDVFKAAVSVKDVIRREALQSAEGWKWLPMPTEPKLVTEWSSSQSCRLERGERYCAEWTKKKFLGVTYDKYCSRYDYQMNNVCSTYTTAMDRYVQVPVEVAYFDSRASFEQVFDEEQEYPLNETESVEFVVTTRPAVCLSRKAVNGSGGQVQFVRSACSAEERTMEQINKSVDVQGPAQAEGEVFDDF